MIELFGFQLGTVFQGGTLAAMLAMLAIVARAYIIGIPDRRRAENEGRVIDNEEAAVRFKEFRVEVHALRNELAVVRAELHKAQNQSARRGDMLNMLRFILQMVIDELASKEPANKVLAQARSLLSRVEDEPHRLDNSDTLTAAEDAHDATGETVRQVKAEEAKK